MKALVIGGTRNLGPDLVARLLSDGAEVAVLNRGVTPDDLPPGVERLRADRRDARAMRAALGRREWDAVVDMTLYDGRDAAAAVELLRGRVGHYVFVSTGQVYLVREGIGRPFRETDYDGPVMPEPAAGTADHDGWTYGVEKRRAEDVLREAWGAHGFPFTSLRLPMVNSARDHYHRLRNYLRRLDDGEPIVAPDGPALPLRHVYGGDVVRAVAAALRREGRGRAYNVSQDETLSLEELLAVLAELAGRPLRLERAPRGRMEAEGLLPAASPFSGRWMSELDNARGREELGLRYTPLRAYLARLVEAYRARPEPVPGYEQRPRELALLRRAGAVEG